MQRLRLSGIRGIMQVKKKKRNSKVTAQRVPCLLLGAAVELLGQGASRWGNGRLF